MLFISDYEVARTAELLRGERDFARCDSGCHTEIPAAICYWAADERVAILSPPVLGLEDSRTVPPSLVTRFGKGVYRAYAGTSPEHFREMVASLLKDRLRPVASLLGGCSEEDFRRRWRELRAPVFAALGIAAEGLLPGVRLSGDALGTFSVVQAEVWICVCEAWAHRAEGLPPVFEDDLRRYVDGWVFPAALEKFSDFTSWLLDHELDDQEEQSYCARAVEAAAYRRAGLPNPAAEKWVVAYVLFEGVLAESDQPERKRARIATERARDTLPAEILREIAEIVIWTGMSGLHRRQAGRKPDWNRDIFWVYQMLERAGHGDIAAGLQRQTSIALPVRELAPRLAAVIDGCTAREAAAILTQRELWWPVVFSGDRADFDMLQASLERKLGPFGAASLLCEMLIEGRIPHACLDYLGRVEGLAVAEPGTRAGVRPGGRPALYLDPVFFWLHVRALTLAGQADEALDEIEDLDRWSCPPSHPLPHKHDAVIAMALRESGRGDRALAILEDRWARGLPDRLLPYMAVELGPAYFAVGRFRESVTVLRKGLVKAEESASSAVPLLRAQLQYALLRSGLPPESELWEISNNLWPVNPGEMPVPDRLASVMNAPPPPGNRLADLYIALAHLEELRREPGAARRSQILDRLAGLSAEAAERGDCFIHVQAERARALDRELRGEPPAWDAVRRVAARYGAEPPVECAIRPAVAAVQTGDLPGALDCLREADRLVTQAVSKLEDFELTAAMEVVRADDRSAFTGIAVATGLPRIAEELWRDPARRLLRRGVVADNATVQAYADKVALPRTAVLESCGGSLVLTINEAGRPPACDVLLPAGDLGPLAARIGTRIANWTPGRHGDPLDVPRWHEFAGRLRAELRARLHPGDHVVVIESADLAPLPWHLALGPSWVFAYAPSWGSMLLRPPPAADRLRVGALAVPRFGESPAVEEALRGSLTASVKDAGHAGLPHAQAEGTRADAEALTGILENTDLCTLLCHGLVNAGTSSVSLLLSADGRLPPGDSVACSRSGLRHQFDWRRAARAARAPRVILSAACSSGLSHVRGGQQVGLFSALRHRGLRTLIAPRWDIMAEQVLPTLDRTRALIIDGRRPGDALRTACLEAEQSGVPAWIAWSLALEGDWI